MASSIRKLTLICPKELEPTIADALAVHDHEIPAYTCFDARGRGSSMALSSASEKVTGAMHTVVFMMVLPSTEIDGILSIVKTTCPTPRISYWVESVEDFGRLI